MSTMPTPDPIGDTRMAASLSSAAITAVDVRKSFDDNVVLDGLELTVEEGTVFALLGPNGSGKTTTVNIVATLLAADAGQVRVAGHDVAREADAVRDAIGLTGQFSAVDDLLTGGENLRRWPTCTTSRVATPRGGSPICWLASSSPTRPTGRCPRTRAGCAAASIWP
jgi:hypothetical protein